MTFFLLLALIASVVAQPCSVIFDARRDCNISASWLVYPEDAGSGTCSYYNQDVSLFIAQGPGTISVMPQLTGYTRFRLTASAVGSAQANISCPYRNQGNSNASISLFADTPLHVRVTSLVLPDARAYYVGIVGWQFGYTDEGIMGDYSPYDAEAARVEYESSTFAPRALIQPSGYGVAYVWGTYPLASAARYRLRFAVRACASNETTVDGHCPGSCEATAACTYDRICRVPGEVCEGLPSTSPAATSGASRLVRWFY